MPHETAAASWNRQNITHANTILVFQIETSGFPAAIVSFKLQALVSDILPSTTAVFSYAIGPRKLSANEQYFVGVQTVVSLLQKTQIYQTFVL